MRIRLLDVTPEERERIRAMLRASGLPTDLEEVEITETVTVQKFDKTDVLAPGVDGLTPFETVTVEDGCVVHVRRSQSGVS
jgi:hypothetical protein